MLSLARQEWPDTQRVPGSRDRQPDPEVASRRSDRLVGQAGARRRTARRLRRAVPAPTSTPPRRRPSGRSTDGRIRHPPASRGACSPGSGRLSSRTSATSTSSCRPPTRARRRRYPTIYMQDGQNLADPERAFAGTWRARGVPDRSRAARASRRSSSAFRTAARSGCASTARSLMLDTAAAEATPISRSSSARSSRSSIGASARRPERRGHGHLRLVDGRPDQPVLVLPRAGDIRLRGRHEPVVVVRQTGR